MSHLRCPSAKGQRAITQKSQKRERTLSKHRRNEERGSYEELLVDGVRLRVRRELEQQRAPDCRRSVNREREREKESRRVEAFGTRQTLSVSVVEKGVVVWQYRVADQEPVPTDRRHRGPAVRLLRDGVPPANQAACEYHITRLNKADARTDGKLRLLSVDTCCGCGRKDRKNPAPSSARTVPPVNARQCLT